VPPQNRLLLLLLALLCLSGCSSVDLHQATVCEEAARILFAEATLDRLTTVPDRSVPHGVRTTVALHDGARHELTCGFESSGPKSADQLALAKVASDVDGTLDDDRLTALHEALERRGIFWKVSWIPTFGGPYQASSPGSSGAETLYFLQLVVNGVTYGAVIGLVAIGYSLIYGVIGVVNLAFGDVYMIGAFVSVAALLLLSALGLGGAAIGIALALPVVMAVTAGYSVITDRIVFKPLRLSTPLMPLVASIGLSQILQNLVFLTGGGHDRWLAATVASGFAIATADGFALYVNRPQLTVLGGAIVLVAATWFILARTAFGRAQRACSQDRRMAALVGIDVDRVIAGTFGLGGALAASGGLMAASYYGGVTVNMGIIMGLKALTASIVGGAGNAMGAVLGGFVVALLESFVAGYFFGGYKEAAVFALLILLLIFRPQGILGEA
jgi:branched-chain amino acid transport system permease protein